MPVRIENMMRKLSANTTGITKIAQQDFVRTHVRHKKDFTDRAR